MAKLYTISDLISPEGVFSDGDWVESKDQDPNGDVRLIQLADIGDGEFLNKSSRFLTTEKAKTLKCTFLEPGDILIARMPDPIGRACIFPEINTPAITVVDVCIVRPKNGDFHPPLIKEFVNSNWFRHQISKHITGTTRKRISRTNLNKIQFRLPSLENQKHIARILSHAEGLIKKRKESLALLDEFLKSTFLEMFGDNSSNDRRWNRIALVDACENKNDVKCGPFGTQLSKSEYQENGIPVWGIPQINSAFRKHPKEYVTESKAIELEQYSVIPDDIVMSRKGNVGKCSLFPRGFSKGIIHSDVLRIRIDKKKILPVFLLFQLKYSRHVEVQIKGVTKGAIMAGINVGLLKRILIDKPPIKLQTQFAQIVEKVESLKNQFQASLQELENLYGSLSQRAFKGELQLENLKIGKFENADSANVFVSEPTVTGSYISAQDMDMNISDDESKRIKGNFIALRDTVKGTGPLKDLASWFVESLGSLLAVGSLPLVAPVPKPDTKRLVQLASELVSKTITKSKLGSFINGLKKQGVAIGQLNQTALSPKARQNLQQLLQYDQATEDGPESRSNIPKIGPDGKPITQTLEDLLTDEYALTNEERAEILVTYPLEMYTQDDIITLAEIIKQTKARNMAIKATAEILKEAKEESTAENYKRALKPEVRRDIDTPSTGALAYDGVIELINNLRSKEAPFSFMDFANMAKEHLGKEHSYDEAVALVFDWLKNEPKWLQQVFVEVEKDGKKSKQMMLTAKKANETPQA